MAKKIITQEQKIEDAQAEVIEATESYRKWARAVAYKANCPDLVQVLLDMPVDFKTHEDYVQSRRTLNTFKQEALIDQLKVAMDADDRAKFVEIRTEIDKLGEPITWQGDA